MCCLTCLKPLLNSLLNPPQLFSLSHLSLANLFVGVCRASRAPSPTHRRRRAKRRRAPLSPPGGAPSASHLNSAPVRSPRACTAVAQTKGVSMLRVSRLLGRRISRAAGRPPNPLRAEISAEYVEELGSTLSSQRCCRGSEAEHVAPYVDMLSRSDSACDSTAVKISFLNF